MEQAAPTHPELAHPRVRFKESNSQESDTIHVLKEESRTKKKKKKTKRTMSGFRWFKT